MKESQNVLVTDEGFWVKVIETKVSGKTVVSYEYKTIEEDGIIYKVKLNNDGSIKEDGKVQVGVVAPEEGADNN